MKRPLKLLAVNPNTSVEVTERFVAEARLALPAGAVLDGVTGRFGAAIVSTRAENAIAAHSALELLARHAGGYDAVILAISFDTALEAAREVMPVPVVGMTEAAVAAARRHGRVGAVTFGGVSSPLYADLLHRYGVDPADIEPVTVTAARGYLEGDRDGDVLQAAARLAGNGVAAVVVCGAAIVGIARRLQPRLALPVYDGAAPAVASALDAVAAGAVPVAIRPLGTTRGIDGDLAALVAGHGPAAHPLPSVAEGCR